MLAARPNFYRIAAAEDRAKSAEAQRPAVMPGTLVRLVAARSSSSWQSRLAMATAARRLANIQDSPVGHPLGSMGWLTGFMHYCQH